VLNEAGFQSGRNVHFEYRWADDDFGKLGGFAADLVNRNVSIIFAGGGDITAAAAKNATFKIPIVFAIGADPIKAGLVKSLSQPGENITGVTFLLVELRPKLIQLIRELLPTARSLAILLDPHRPNATAVEKELILSDPVFLNHQDRILPAIERLAVPTVYPAKGFALRGGLLSYGADLAPAYRAAGRYVARILKGESPGKVPIQQAEKIELVVNLTRAKALHLLVPESLLARADEVIE